MGIDDEGRATHASPNSADGADFVRTGAALLVTGHDASALRDALVKQIVQAAQTGIAEQDMLVICADPCGAARIRQELQARCDLDVPRIQIATCRELACSIIEQPSSYAATGTAFSAERTRILAAYETDFVTEDVKTLGAPPKRLRELLKFLYRGWTELADENPDWLITAEEIDTLAFLTAELSYLGAVMEPQISNLAAKALRLDARIRGQVMRRRVFVLDYQNLSRASQLVCQLVASEKLVAVANGQGCANLYESYPYPQGIDDFALLNPAARIEQLDDAGAGNEDCDVQRVEHVWTTPENELSGIADTIAAMVAQEHAPERIAVMTLHPWWAQRMGRALEARGVPANIWYEPLRLRGDVRDLDRCLPLHVLTLLRLLADPQDGTAWRSWFGFGDYLTRSNQFTPVRQSASATGDVRRDLETFGYDLGTDLDPLFDAAHDLRGPELLAYLMRTLAGPDAPLPSMLKSLFALGPDASAAQMVAEIDRRQFFDGIPLQKGVVVSSYASMSGLDFDQVYAIGFVNGLFPSAAYFDLTKISVNKQKKMGEQDLRTAHAMAQLARKELCVSRFEYADHEFAERVGLKQARIFATDESGTMASEVDASIYTDVLLGRRQTGETT